MQTHTVRTRRPREGPPTRPPAPGEARWRRRLAWLAPLAALGVLGVLAGAGSPWQRPLATSLVFVLATAGAMHRPLGGATLGLGALVLPAGILAAGPLPAALAGGAAGLVAAGLRRLLRRRLGAPPARLRRPADVAVADAASLALAILAAGLAWRAGDAPASPLAGTDAPLAGWWLLTPPLAYGLTFALAWVLLDRLRGALRGGDGAAELAPLALDLLGWGLGLAILAAAAPLGWPRTWLLVALASLLVAEAARAALVAEVTADRLDEMRRLTDAHHRILGETSGSGAIAAQVLEECLNVLPVHTFQLELFDAEDGRVSWTAGDDGVLREGEPRPPAVPPMLPGIHRGARWRVIEHALAVEDEEVLAILRLWCDPRRLEPGAEALFATLVPHMASAVDRARLDREAKLDPLTGVPVRRVLDARLQQVFRRTQERGRSMAVILCDVDHFKRINDTWGHEAGDQALIAVAHALEETRRENDLCCRYGGEEFTVLLEDTTGVQALELAERLRRAVAAIDLIYDGEAIQLRMSAGVAAFPELHVKTGSELLVLADEALYAAKTHGRNRCLLNLGRGTFRDRVGRTVRSGDAPRPSEPPRVFG